MEFETLADAWEAGWRSVGANDRPVYTNPTGLGSLPALSHYEDSEGRPAVGVFIRTARNTMGTKGAFVDMFPPCTE